MRNQKNKNLCFFFLGRNTAGIARDARTHLPVALEQYDIVLLTREGEQLAAPEIGQIVTCPLSQFDRPAGPENLVVANGGTTAQLVSLLARFAHAREALAAYDVQPDGCTLFGVS